MPTAKKRLTFLCTYFAICKKGQSQEKSNIQIIFRRSDMFSFLSQMQYDKTKIAKYLHVNCTFLNVCGDDTYGNTGFGVFKGGLKNWKGFWLKINCSQMKLPNLENWSSGELSKSAKI